MFPYEINFKKLFFILVIFALLFHIILSKFDKISREGGKQNNLKFLENTNKEDNIIKASLFMDDNDNFILKDGMYEDAIAYLKYTDGLGNKGWDFLAVSSYQGDDIKYSDDLKSYAMGYLEGVITAEKIWNHYNNQRRYYFFDQPEFAMPKTTREFLEKNAEFIREMGKANGDSDPYWYHARLIHRQLEGLLDGYNSAFGEGERKLTLEDLNVCNARGDLSELAYYNSTLRPNFGSMDHFQIIDHIEEHTHCSSLIKVAPDFSDIWFGHNTWTNFSSMMRIFKEYRFVSNEKTEKSKVVAFSGYPGVLTSIDDFYITDQDLFITETTNSIFDTKLYDLLTPRSLLTWLRSILANRLSDNAQMWTDVFSKYNSGTYNNQFQILDLKLIDTYNKKIEENAFWIIEQIPGRTQSQDMTHILKYGYWPSYNSAYFQEIRKISGYDEQLSLHPELKDSIDYSSCARANIFRRDQHKVNNLESYKKLLRYNDFLHDPFSKNNPALAIACRGDLDEKKPNCRGATDAKVASIHDIKGKKQKKITIISGPTNDQLPSFDFLNAKCMESGKYSFKGLPQYYNFTWIEYETTLFD